MVNLVYPNQTLDTSCYNQKERTFSGNDQYWNWTVEWLLHKCGVVFSKSTEPKKHNKNYCCLNLYNPHSFKDFLNLPQHYIDYLQREDTKLLLYQATEANSYWWLDDAWNNFYNILSKMQIPADKICFITGDLNGEHNHKKFEHSYFSEMHVCSVEIWEMIHYDRIEYKETPSILESLNTYICTPKQHNFINLNALVRPNKQACLYYLHKDNLLDSNIVSCLWQHQKHIADQQLFDRFNYDNSNYNNFLDFIQNFYSDLYKQHTFLSPLELYYKTKFSLVSETHTMDYMLFFTEKTYKPIAIGHPFQIFGTAGTLSYLQSRGYETFPELFDESYDNEYNRAQRLKTIVDNCKQDVEITPAIIEKLRHNRHLFFQQNMREITGTRIEEFLS